MSGSGRTIDGHSAARARKAWSVVAFVSDIWKAREIVELAERYGGVLTGPPDVTRDERSMEFSFDNAADARSFFASVKRSDEVGMLFLGNAR